jgi:hypothetical protein
MLTILKKKKFPVTLLKLVKTKINPDKKNKKIKTKMKEKTFKKIDCSKRKSKLKILKLKSEKILKIHYSKNKYLQ